MVLHHGWVYVPRDQRLRADILQLHHDAPTAGHPGHWKTLELVTCNYWWPGLPRYVARYVRGCDACNRVKTFPTQKVSKLILNKVPDHQWQVILVDMISELPESCGNNTILVVVDCLSKCIHAILTMTSLDS